MIAMSIPITTNTTIAICIHIQVGDITEQRIGGSYGGGVAGRQRKLTAGHLSKLAVALTLYLCALAWPALSGATSGAIGVSATNTAPLGVSATSTAPIDASATNTAPLGGVNVAGVAGNLSPSLADREIARAHDLHAKLVRAEVAWSTLEPSGPGEIEPRALAYLDRLVSDAAASGIGVIATVDSTPCWASSAAASLLRKCMPGQSSKANAWAPREPSAYAAFVAYLAARYGTRLAAIEVWNEPDQANEDYFAGPNKPQRYAALLRAAYPAIKQANPNVEVLAGSLVGSNGVFLRALYAAGIKGYYDGLAVHFYNLILGSLRAIHEVQLANGDNTPLWLDEFGWSSCWPRQKTQQEQGCVTAGAQADNITNLVRSLARTSYIAAEVLYKLQDSTRENFGVLSTKGKRKPAFAALAGALANPFGGLTFVSLHLARRHGGVLASGAGPVGDYMQLEAFQGKVLRYKALFTLDRFNRYAIPLPRVLGTHGLTVRVYQYWQGPGRDSQRSI